MATCEVVNGALQVTGNLDKAADPDFQSALEKYVASSADPVLDLSSVRWLNNTVAKMIIQSATDVLEKNSRLRVLSSRHVQQTLNLLGAQAYLTIEAAAKPVAAPEAAAVPEPTKALVGLDDADLMMPELSTPIPGAGMGGATAAVATNPDDSKVMVRPPIPAPPAPVHAPAPRASGLLVSPTEELSRGAVLFRMLHINQRYSFIIRGQEVVGIVKERVGGSWVLVETSGRRKVLNLDVVEMVEML